MISTISVEEASQCSFGNCSLTILSKSSCVCIEGKDISQKDNFSWSFGNSKSIVQIGKEVSEKDNGKKVTCHNLRDKDL